MEFHPLHLLQGAELESLHTEVQDQDLCPGKVSTCQRPWQTDISTKKYDCTDQHREFQELLRISNEGVLTGETSLTSLVICFRQGIRTPMWSAHLANQTPSVERVWQYLRVVRTEVWIQTEQRKQPGEHPLKFPFPDKPEVRVYLGTSSSASNESISNAVSVISSLSFTTPDMPGEYVSRVTDSGATKLYYGNRGISLR